MRIFLEYLKVGLWMLPIILPALWLLPRLSKRYAARVSYVIWLVLAVRLLIPWNLTLPQETAPIHVAISEEQANEWVQAKFNPLADGMLYLVVFVGGFFGTAIRYGLSLLLPNPAAPSGLLHSFHTATFIANMLACFIFAALSTYMSQAAWIRKRIRQLVSRGVGMGMCGGFSTLSAMMIEDLNSLRAENIVGFVTYTLLSFICGLIIAWLGTMLGLALTLQAARAS